MERHHDPPDGTASAGWVQIWDSTSYTGSYTGNTDGGYLAQDNNLGTLNDHVRSARFTRSILGDAPRWSLRGPRGGATITPLADLCSRRHSVRRC